MKNYTIEQLFEIAGQIHMANMGLMKVHVQADGDMIVIFAEVVVLSQLEDIRKLAPTLGMMIKPMGSLLQITLS